MHTRRPLARAAWLVCALLLAPPAPTRARQDPDWSRHLQFVRIESRLLSEFHHRPVFLRAGVLLPRDFYTSPDATYPVRIQVGGFNARCDVVRELFADDGDFRDNWFEGAPLMLFVHLDGAGPNGDPPQVNSANNGPWGDAVTQELIPAVERRFRGVGAGYARFLDGHSTGGWTALALQVFYPDFFGGAWASSPDPVDFRAFQRVNIYAFPNAYTDPAGQEIPVNRDGEKMRSAARSEETEALKDGNRILGQFAAWNAVFGPRGDDGKAVPLFNLETGAIDPRAVEEWRKKDLRLYLEQNWAAIGPRLRGKIRITVGTEDDYFLNEAVELLEQFLKQANPPADARILYGKGQGHRWRGFDDKMQEMARVYRLAANSAAGTAGRPASADQ